MMKCNFCGKDLLLIEVAIVRYVEHSYVMGLDPETDEIEKGEDWCDEILDIEPTHYMCSKCKEEVRIPASYGSVENQIEVWLRMHPDYQKED